MNTPGLEITGITKRLGGALILDRVSLTVADGELLVLVGPSGSGKSTLLRVIAGLIQQDAGEIRIAGRDVGAMPPARRNAAMVFQSYALFPHMTVEQNLSFGMRARGESSTAIGERVSRVAGVLAIEALLSRYPRELSGGERQRVALGRAMLREPALFLMDEPLSNLDAQLRVLTRAEIVRLQSDLGTTTVYVTHDQVEALSMGDRIGVLHQGRLEQIGTPMEIYREPRSLFVARFMGTPAMNTLTVEAAPPDRVRWRGLLTPIPPRLHLSPADAGRALVLGVRPEHIFMQGSRWAMGAPPSDAMTATVDLVQLAGDQVFVDLTVAGQPLIARAEPDFAVKRGDQLSIWFDTDAVHLFDPVSERALSGKAPRVTRVVPSNGMFFLAVPLLTATVLLVVAPAIVALAFAFTEYDALSSPRLVGFANFRHLWDDPLFWKSARNSFYLGMISVPMRIALALGLALLLTPQQWGARTTRLSAYLPSVVPDIAYALLWLWMLNPIYGPISLGLQSAGLARPDWLLTEWGARWSIVLMGLFQIGELYVVLLAARRELPGELYELCMMEGVSGFWTFRRVTLPLLVPTLVFLAARDVAWSFQATFVPSLVITKGGPDFATLFMPLYIFQNGFEYLRFGYASAMTVAMFLLTAVMAGAQVGVLQIWRSRR